MSKEARLGLLVIIAVFALLLFSPGQHRRPPVLGHAFNLIFTHVEGLRVGDTVKVAGVPEGNITAIDFATPEEQRMFGPLVGDQLLIRVTVTLQRFVALPENSSYEAVATLNGERYINITPGSGDTFLTPGDSYLGKSRTQREDQLTTTLQTFKMLNRETSELREVISDPAFRLQVKDTASNLRFYSRELKEVAADLSGEKGLIAQFEDQVDTQEQALHDQLASMDAQVSQVQSQLETMTPRATEGIEQWNRRVVEGRAQLSSVLLQALSYSDRFEQALRDLEQGSANPDKVKRALEQIKKASLRLEDIAAIAGDLRAITSDPQVQQELKQMVDNLRERAANLKAAIEKFEESLDF
ncbi:MAG: MCE family protein [Armatimonadetes bacterium]|nr:MCE family protein [Armatimonadota bacterium]